MEVNLDDIDDLSAARGIVNGLVISIPFWAVVALLYWR